MKDRHTSDIDERGPLPKASLVKVPRQQRSIEMIHNILDAAMDLLVAEGSSGFTANKVAAHASISPGSLYQYFANKEMIISGIIERALIHAQQLILEASSNPHETDISLFLRKVLLSVYEMLKDYRPVMREIFTGLPLLSESSVPAAMETSLMDAMRNYLLVHQDRYRLRGGLATIWVASNSVIFVFLKWMVDEPAYFSRDEFIDALVAQVMVGVERLS